MTHSPSSPATASLPEWEDPRVQIVYELLCNDDLNTPPNPEEHWEGWVSRNIVAALCGDVAARTSEPVSWRWKVAPTQINWQYSDAPPATFPVYNLELLYAAALDTANRRIAELEAREWPVAQGSWNDAIEAAAKRAEAEPHDENEHYVITVSRCIALGIRGLKRPSLSSPQSEAGQS